MSDNKFAVFGIYATRQAVEDATKALNAAGFPESVISALTSGRIGGSGEEEEAVPGIPAGGAVGGALVGMGLPEYEDARYEGQLQAGGILLSVHCDTPGEIMRAKEVVTSTGAEHISSSGESLVETMRVPVMPAGPRPT